MGNKIRSIFKIGSILLLCASMCLTHAPVFAEMAAPAQQEAGTAEQVAQQVTPADLPMVDPGNVTVNFKGADINTVLAYISEVAGVDIVAAPDVKGLIDLKLSNKPWKSALDIIVRNYGFAYEREGDIIRVVTLSKLKQEELETQTFSLNYSKSKDIIPSLKNILGERGKVINDERTNTLVVTDIPTNLYKIAQVVERLDKQTQQVLIEARIIETVLGEDEKLGIDWSVKVSASGASRPWTAPFDYFDVSSKALDKYMPLSMTSTDSAQGAGAGSTAVLVPAADFATNPVGPKNFPFAVLDDFKFGTLDFTEFKAVLELLKSRSDTETVSNPRIATLNNNKATINVGQVINLPKFERNSSTGKMEITGYDEKNAGVILNVTPHVNDNKEIAIELAPEITEYLGSQPIAPGSDVYAPLFRTRQANTQVMMRDGQTIFIGGLISDRDVERKSKLPFIGDMLGDVPYLGLLFSKKEITKERVELIFFITVNIMTHDRAIKGSPLPDKAYVPMYSDTQLGDTSKDKKKLKKKQ